MIDTEDSFKPKVKKRKKQSKMHENILQAVNKIVENSESLEEIAIKLDNNHILYEKSNTSIRNDTGIDIWVDSIDVPTGDISEFRIYNISIHENNEGKIITEEQFPYSNVIRRRRKSVKVK